ncbi:ACT domain-containing protein [Shewanella subflava]|uniref:ACT domain-containing protein n=1 Tax=Shewanella subflava TaxID=2986476 RepID=A0ABT3I6C4_9GAMM|nr:ACT domain-containing protein [Shewanella subflava]MCW3171553.1 ACT domain-containing protein [Shewanella subflava]
MSGITDLNTLLQSMQPQLLETEWVFCSVKGRLGDYLALNPIATFMEPEGLTLVLEKLEAIKAGLVFEQTFCQITLSVHSSLEAVGLTAAVAAKLTAKGISANVIAAYYHDHIFVPSAKASAALVALQEFALPE